MITERDRTRLYETADTSKCAVKPSSFREQNHASEWLRMRILNMRGKTGKPLEETAG
jgi:hypothetical protein